MKIIDMNEHKGWGDSIYFTDYKRRKIAGHLTPKPENGDKIKLEMKFDHAGRYFRLFTIINLEDFSDPPDQFFADAVDTGIVIERDGKSLIFEIKSGCPLCKKKLGKKFDKMLGHIEKKHKASIMGEEA